MPKEPFPSMTDGITLPPSLSPLTAVVGRNDASKGNRPGKAALPPPPPLTSKIKRLESALRWSSSQCSHLPGCHPRFNVQHPSAHDEPKGRPSASVLRPIRLVG